MPEDCLHDCLDKRRPDASDAGSAAEFDRWLRRALLSRLAPLTDSPLPPVIAVLAAELELKLRQARRQ